MFGYPYVQTRMVSILSKEITMLHKRILPLMALLISFSSPLFAQVTTTPVAEEAIEKEATVEATIKEATAEETSGKEAPAENSSAYRIYEVKKGDTLWGISKKFIEDPYYWPDLWANNPDIQNPHFVYPGQKLRIYAGPIVVVGIEEQETTTPPTQEVATPEITSVPAEPAVEAEESITIAVPNAVSFIAEGEQSAGGTIFDFPDARHFAGSGDTVFVRVPNEKRVVVGDRMQVIKSRADIIHPVSRKRLGFQVDQVGTLEIAALGKDLQTAVIRKSYREIERGAWLSPRRAVREQIALRRATHEMSGMVVATASHKELQGPNEVLFVDIGESKGLRVGNLLTLIRPRKATDLAPIKNRKDAALVYPEELIGYALVIDTNPETASVVILKSLGPAVVGDLVRAQTGRQTR
jgi:LysM repeat protein